MDKKPKNPYAKLERIFHEPNRLAIMSNLCGAINGVTFTELKEACELTDGNLSRHLRTLQEQGAVRIEKEFVGVKPKTTVFLSDKGRKSFVRYLEALEDVLKTAAKKVRKTAGAKKIKIYKNTRVRPSEA